jgi:Regulator of chromosome condensation (RCC1) repeat
MTVKHRRGPLAILALLSVVPVAVAAPTYAAAALVPRAQMVAAASAAEDSGYRPVQPARLLDTRPGAWTIDGQGAPNLPVGPATTIDIPILGRGGLPASGVAAVAVNITAVNPTAPGFITAYPTGIPLPTASNLNFPAGDTRPNLVIVPLGTNGNISLYNATGTTHLLADIQGWYPEPSMAFTMAAEDTSTCAVRDDQTVACWGSAIPGHVSLVGYNPSSYEPTTVPGLYGVVDVAVGYVHGCALLNDHRVSCWGYDTVFGALGRGADSGYAFVPAPVVGLRDVVAIDAGLTSTCAVRSTGKVSCWGSDSTGIAHPRPYDIVGLDDATSVSVGLLSACATRRAGTVACWGSNSTWVLGNGSGPDSPTTAATVEGLGDVVEVSVGGAHACALLASTQVRCWGLGGDGQLGNNVDVVTTFSRPVPVISGLTGTNLTGATTIGASRLSTCASLVAGDVACWGRVAMLGIPDASSLRPHSTGDSVNFAWPQGREGQLTVHAGGFHTCSIDSDGHVTCWGFNTDEQLGDGTNVNAPLPVDVLTLS